MARDLSQMPGDLAKRVAKIDQAIERSRKDTVRAAAMAAKGEHLDVMRGDAGGDLRLSRVRSGRGSSIGVRFSVSGDSAEVKATGPVPLLANRIGPHRIPKAGRKRKPIVIPGVGVRMSANHPGTKGKDTWNRGRERAEPKVSKIVAKRTDTVVKKAFLSGG